MSDESDKNKKYLDYLNKHASRMKMWREAWGTSRPPVWEDDRGQIHWANRAQRRKAEQGK